LRLSDLLERVSGFAHDGQRHRVMYANIHVLNIASHDLELRRILNAADIVYCDGSGVRWGARLLGVALPERMTGADWIHPACQRWEAEGLRVFFLGGVSNVAERAVAKLTRLYPALNLVGAHSGFFDDSAAVVAAINTAQPDVLLVGMGTPVQERWIDENFDHLGVPVVWGMGALMDFVSDQVQRGPRWMTDHGFEWLARLVTEPRRLWKRYLVGNPLFLWRVLKQRMGWTHVQD
jgi:N-acetylglucosaminyldiphosphoundecaprenol N-acetyl-beta-D-mannosaminyltransferase